MPALRLPSLRHAREGSALLVVVSAITIMGLLAAWVAMFQGMTIQTIRARNILAETNLAAESAVRTMAERVVALAEHELGAVSQAHLDSLGSDLADIPLPEGLELDLQESRYVLESVESDVALADDIDPLLVTADHPRFAFDAAPALAGLRARQVTRIRMIATVRGPRGGRRSADMVLAVARVLPYQAAIATAGDVELCVSGGVAYVEGAVKAEGDVRTRCSGDLFISGKVQARNAVHADGTGSQAVVWEGGSAPLSTVTRGSSLDQVQSAWGGRVVLDGLSGGDVHSSPFQTASLAGRGECQDLADGCAGTSSFFPSVQVQRQTTGMGAEYQIWCGYAYGGADCSSDLVAVQYYPFPFTTGGTPGAARLDPADPNQLWQGLFADYRREGLCSAELAGNALRTYRCPTNPYGFVVDVSGLPAIPGGLVSVLRSSQTNSVNNASGFQEVVLLKNAEALAGPLTLVSQIPVVIMGSFNSVSPKPAMIDAPLVTVLPASAEEQLAMAAAWDSTAPGRPVVLQAREAHEVRAVIRSDYHVTSGVSYYGGTLEQIPAVLGDWSGAPLAVIGAVEGRSVLPSTPGSYATAHAGYGAGETLQPSVRRVHFDAGLLDPTRQPPGSWAPTNLPPSGAGGSRTRERQANAAGGYTVVYLVQDALRQARIQP